MVLLKNDGILPLKSVRSIAVVGSLADQTAVLLGNYAGIPSRTVSMLDGMKAEFPDAKITYVPGTQFLSTHGDPVPSSVLTAPDGKRGLRAEYGSSPRPGTPFAHATPLASRVGSGANLNEHDLPAEAKGAPGLVVQWTGFLNPDKTGDYLLGVRGSGAARVFADDARVAQYVLGGAAGVGFIHLERGHPVKLRVNFARNGDGAIAAQLIWAPVTNVPDPAAIAAAKNADVVVAVVGITSRLEGEEMSVQQPGFLGGDRTSIDLPKPEEDLVQAIAATGKPLVVVLMNGSALGVNWEKAHANAVLEAWYPGEEGGTAIAETLSGKNNPAGRLPVTFYKDIAQLPHFENYSMRGRTYRYFDGEPLWRFGYGLSYTTFGYGNLTLPDTLISAGDSLNASVTVANTGKIAGDEVVQLYLKFPEVPGAPIRALRGFERIHLEAGANQIVRFHLGARDLSMVTEAGDIIVAEGQYTVSIGGGQPGTTAPTVVGTFRVKGSKNSSGVGCAQQVPSEKKWKDRYSATVSSPRRLSR